MKQALAVSILVLVAAGLAACTSAPANRPGTRPALEVPQPPPRVVEPIPAEPVTQIEPVADLPPPPTTTSRPRQTASRESASREPAKPEAKPETPPAPDPAAQPAPPAANPAPQIRNPADNSETARQVRDMLTRANKGLANVDYNALTPPRKESYEDAKRFATQAEEAFKIGNFGFALKLAEKADTIAKELQGR